MKRCFLDFKTAGGYSRWGNHVPRPTTLIRVYSDNIPTLKHLKRCTIGCHSLADVVDVLSHPFTEEKKE